MSRTWTAFFIIAAMLGAFPAWGATGRGEADPVANLMPVPESVTRLEGRFRVDETLTIAGGGDAAGRAFRAAGRFMSRLAGRTGIFFKQEFLVPWTGKDAPSLRYGYERPGRLKPGEDESYVLEILPGGIRLEAPTDIGILRGFETLLQLLAADEKGYTFPAIRIEDRPRFTWRGLLLDPGRHFLSVGAVKRNLDGMAAVKMNVLHWHLTEDQGFRIECRTFPGLHEKGSDGLYYTQDQVRDIIAYAADRGIRVMPEFDIPGHATSWFVAHPELASAPGPYSVERRFGVWTPAFNPADDRVYAFLDKFFAEMSELFPDPYMHIGGDEVDGKAWDANPEIQAFKKKMGLADNHALQAYFNKRILEILERHGKIMVGWDEIFQPDLPQGIVIHSWRGPDALAEAARKGYRGILSHGYYIDLCQPAEFHYLNDPLPEGSTLTGEEKARVLGGEATMWGELVSEETVDSRIWPRTAAIAERLWSPASVRDVEDMYRRLEHIGFRLEEHGLTHIKNQDMMLRRLAGRADIQPLKTLASVTEPLKRYQRHSQGTTYTTLSPLTRFVDACAPESMTAREFRRDVDLFLENRADDAAGRITARLALWRTVPHSLQEYLEDSPALREIGPLAEALADAASLGLQAMERLEKHQFPRSAWIKDKLERLAKAAGPKAHAELAVVSGIEKLLKALERAP